MELNINIWAKKINIWAKKLISGQKKFFKRGPLLNLNSQLWVTVT
jgi:hypothetical protein